MATHDASSFASGAGVSSLSWSHTAAASAKMIVQASWAFDALASITGGSYNSSALTALGAKQTGGGSQAIRGFYHDSPSSGTNTVSMTLSGSLDSVAAAATTATSSNTPTGYATGSGSTTTITATAGATVGASDVVVAAIQTPADPTMTAATGRTLITEAHPSNYHAFAYQPGSTSDNIVWTQGTPDSFVWMAARFPDAGGGGGGGVAMNSTLTMMGIQ